MENNEKKPLELIDGKPYIIKPGTRLDLSKLNPEDTGSFEGDKKAAKKWQKELRNRLRDLQELLYAQGKHKILIVLQGLDTAGKDGTIKGVLGGVNPQGIAVKGFKAPTPEELSHDYLWRIHKHTPEKGKIAIFNRSHYEDVLVVRVHKLVSPETCKKRYSQINNFEKMLTEEGTTVLKFFLNISREEQKRRLQKRLDNPEKHWKFNPGDLKERKLWQEYINAYQDAISATSTPWAPWHIIPADKKWYRNLVVGSIIINKLESLNMKFPAPDFDPGKIRIE